MRLFGIAGHSGMGKTTLLERLVPEIVGRGLRVSLLKHSHKAIDVDRPGKDSYRLREAGCSEVLLLGAGRWALMHELRADTEPTLGDLLPRLTPCDLLLVEGFKRGAFPKIEVWRGELQRPPLWPQQRTILAVATDDVAALPLPAAPEGPVRLSLRETAAIADFALTHAIPATAVNPD
jgi:molybdopterin-guanine dinucleotide biosynthesis protein B